MKIKKLIATDCDAKFDGLTLLSAKEYIKSRKFITPLNAWWWLRSPGYISGDASYVNKDGRLSCDSVGYASGSVRPVLILKSSFSVGDKFKYYDHNWTVISKKYALCDEAFCQMAFREYWAAKDANDYEASDIKRYLDSEWNKMMEGEQDERHNSV